MAYHENCWSDGKMAALISAWGNRYIKLNRSNLRQKQWEVAKTIISHQGASASNFGVIVRELKPEEMPVSKVMTRNPTFVLADMVAVTALQKMVQGVCAQSSGRLLCTFLDVFLRKPLVSGKFRHLPVVENGEVVVLVDIAKCLYDAIARMERASEKGKAIAAAVEGVEKHWGTAVSGL
jgi:CBS domain-containing protein